MKLKVMELNNAQLEYIVEFLIMQVCKDCPPITEKESQRVVSSKRISPKKRRISSRIKDLSKRYKLRGK